MITYILEILEFQLVSLLAYDLFLMKETFFGWNRFYLLGSFVLSLVLPWIKLEVLSTPMPEELGGVTLFLTQLDPVVVSPGNHEPGFWASLPWFYWILALGSLLAAFSFAIKLSRIGRLKREGKVERFPDFVKITVAGSSLAFSFFKNIFLGEEIQRDRAREQRVLAHELVHVRGYHSLDHIFVELARILFWFNPLVYLYQWRMAELHEFIADAQVVKTERRDHFQLLLSQAFETHNISFVNQFFHKSLIKKRILMIQKNRSKAVWQLKYVLFLPLVLGMLFYTSCEGERPSVPESTQGNSLDPSIEHTTDGVLETYTLRVGDLDALTQDEERLRSELLDKTLKSMDKGVIKMVDENQKLIQLTIEKGDIKSVHVDKSKDNGVSIHSFPDKEPTSTKELSVPFAVIDQVPVFPGCEDAKDQKACFQEKLQQHVIDTFRYPEEAFDKDIQGRVSVMFIVGTDGSIVDIMTRGPHELLEGEARRIIGELPQMQAGKHNGKVVKVPFSIPITFKLHHGQGDRAAKTTKTSDGINVSGTSNMVDNRSIYRGRITDGASLALPGATVSVEGSQAGTVSDFDGNFAIAASPGDVVKIQYTGLSTKTMVVPKSEL